MKTYFKGTKKVIRLCRRNGCCPEVHVENNHLVVTDDYGNTVRLQRDTLDDLKNALSEFMEEWK